MTLTINDLIQISHNTAKEKGWKLDNLKSEIDKKMTTQGSRKIEYLSLQI